MTVPYQFEEMAKIRAATTTAVEAGETLTRLANHLSAACRTALDGLTEMTSDEFARGADRPIRVALVQALAMIGAATDDERREYGA